MTQKVRSMVFDVDDTMLGYTAGLRDFANQYYGHRIEGLPEHYSLEDWIPGSEYERRNILRAFNKSWQFGCLQPLPGACKYIMEIVEYNKTATDPIELVALTKCGKDPITQALRKANLTHVFGIIFSEVIIIDGDESKKHSIRKLKRHRDIVLSVDDYVQNAVDMDQLNVPTVILRSSTNVSVTSRYLYLPVAEDWEDLYKTHIQPLLV
ncbi:HAD-like domain protein [Vibrio phage 2.275.O._10N.286.54.E11]|nr:HAD-like domain protein [Vibrio phage 2.275.O._10N.286.54.E11]